MKIDIKGTIGRLSFVLAIVSIVPGIVWGVEDFRKAEIERREKFLTSMKEWAKGWDEGRKNSQWDYSRRGQAEEPMVKFSPQKKPKKPLKYYIKLVGSGVGGGVGSFLLVLLGMRGSTHLVLWIITGFKEEKSQIKNEEPKSRQPLSDKEAIWKWIVTGED